MDLLSVKTIKGLLIKYQTRPSRGLGQNFLINKGILEKIIKVIEIKPNDVILEVGPGLGTLTQELARCAKKVIAIEKSAVMCQILGETLKDFKNIKIIQEDILKIKNSNLFKNLKIKNYKIISNIPYYLTSPLIRKFLENPHPPSDMILMLQKEVAQRICALRQAQGKPNMNLLAVSVQFYAEPKIISYVSKNCFWPSPKVDSAIIKIIPKALEGQTFQCPPKNFFKIVKAGFSHPRKQLVNNLTGSKLLNGVKLDKVKISKWLLENNIKPEQRPETLSVLNWENLTKSYAKFIQC